MSELKLKQVTNCVLVKGIMRSTLCDLQRGKLKLIPNDMYDMLKSCAGQTKDEIYEKYSDYVEILEEYIDFLESNEFIFWTDEPSSYPEISFEVEEFAEVNNAIIDVSSTSILDYPSIINELSSLGCQSIQIRSFDDLVNLKWITEKLLEKTLDSRIRNIEIICKHHDEDNEYLVSMLSSHLRVNLVVLHSSLKGIDVESKHATVLITTDKINDASHCGFVDPSYFSINANFYSESLKYNTCLYKKVSIDSDGNIKNCPALLESFGHISVDSIREVIQSSNFKRIGKISKDQISICKVCEFRHVCPDCRAHLGKEELFSKPRKCAYDPYTAKWHN